MQVHNNNFVRQFVLILVVFLFILPYFGDYGILMLAGFSATFLLILLWRPPLGLIIFYLLISAGTILVEKTETSILDPGTWSVTYEGMISFAFVAGSIFLIFYNIKKISFIKTIVKTPGLLVFLAFIFVCLLETVVFHSEKIASFKELIKIAAIILFYAVAVLYFRREDIYIIQNSLLLVLAALVAYSIMIYVTQPSAIIDVGGIGISRLSPGILSAVDLSVWIAVLFPILITKIMQENRIIRIVLWSIAVVISGYMMTRFSARASVFSLAIALLIYQVARRKYVLASILAVSFGALILLTPWKNMVIDIFYPYGNSTILSRVEGIWAPILKSDISNIIFGVGARGFGEYLYKISGWYFTAAHNIYLNILVENGIFAVILFVLANMQILFKMIKKYRNNARLLLNVVPLIVLLFSGLTSTINFTLFYLQIFMFLAINLIAERPRITMSLSV